MKKLKQTTGHYTGDLTVIRPSAVSAAQTPRLLSLMLSGRVNKVASVVDFMEQSVHKLFREMFGVYAVTICFNMKIYKMASLACIVQSPYSVRDFNRFIKRPRPYGMGETRNPLRRNR